MVLAAGLGTRMRPITQTIPKPLVKVAGKTLIDRALEALGSAGVRRAAVNVHYLPEQVEHHLANHRGLDVQISDERHALLDSGGGVKHALPHLEPGALFILNADSFWVDRDGSNLSLMARKWRGDDMDMLLLLAPKGNSVGFSGAGDFFMADDGRLTRRGTAQAAPYAFAGVSIANTALFERVSEEKFSLNQLFDEAIANQRLFGCVLDGLWLHVGTPAAIAEAEAAISDYDRREG